jgi:hypothetical protein
MNDDRWLQEMAQMNRDRDAEERSRLDERWDRLSAGELSAEEEAELRALAATSEDARDAYEAFKPLGAEFQARIVRAIQSQAPAPAAETAQVPRAKVLPFRRRARLAGWSASVAAAAAAVLVFFLGPAASFPNYSLYLTAISSTRGEPLAPGKVKVFAPGDRIPVKLEPPTATSHLWPWDAECFLSGGDGTVRLEDFDEAISAKGVATMKCAIRGDQSLGRRTLWAVVGRLGKLPDPADLRASSTLGPVRGRDWVALGEEILIQPRPVPP